jgi:hypothetical protein
VALLDGDFDHLSVFDDWRPGVATGRMAERSQRAAVGDDEHTTGGVRRGDASGGGHHAIGQGFVALTDHGSTFSPAAQLVGVALLDLGPGQP